MKFLMCLIFLERNPWKKKYLDEKRRTTVLEEELNGMKVELVNQQRKLFKLLEGKGELC